MKRREFITLLGGAAVAWPLLARAQQPAVPVIGYLSSGSRDSDAFRVARFRQGLNETGYVEGRNVTIEFRWADHQNDWLPMLAADLVDRKVAVIATIGGGVPSALAAKAATTSIPIVFRTGSNPIDAGLVTSLSRPGGNITGVTNLNVEVGPKLLELLHELVPMAGTVALLVNPTNPSSKNQVRDLQAAARILGLQLEVLQASTESDSDGAFAAAVRGRAAALMIGADPLFISRSEQLATLTARLALPTISNYREFSLAGGLMSYGGRTAEADRLVGVYTGRILKGEKPVDLPVQQVTQVVLTVNLKTAKALGIEVPMAILLRADEVIE
jgi:putative ABC transport system substrate-binding protein